MRQAAFRPSMLEPVVLSCPGEQRFIITAYDDNAVSTCVQINGMPFSHSLLLLPDSAPLAWSATHFQMLQVSHFADIVHARPDVLILGTGQCQHFVSAEHIQALMVCGIGVECMSNAAACSTYNILVADRRRVACGLIIENLKTEIAHV